MSVKTLPNAMVFPSVILLHNIAAFHAAATVYMGYTVAPDCLRQWCCSTRPWVVLLANGAMKCVLHHTITGYAAAT